MSSGSGDTGARTPPALWTRLAEAVAQAND